MLDRVKKRREKLGLKPLIKKPILQMQTETQVQKSPLYLVLKTEYFDEILAGTKIKEYREDSEFYESRFLSQDRTRFKNYHSVIFQNGYHKNARRMTVKIKKITLGFRFIIHLGEILKKNF